MGVNNYLLLETSNINGTGSEKKAEVSIFFQETRAALFTRTSNNVLISVHKLISLSVHTTLLKEFLTKLVS